MDKRLKEQVSRASSHLGVVTALPPTAPIPPFTRPLTEAELDTILAKASTALNRAALARQLDRPVGEITLVFAIAYGPRRPELVARQIHAAARRLGYVVGGGSGEEEA
jgi:hypothetical protein